VYDLELPSDFVPVNSDGEVDVFHLMPIEEVIANLHLPDAFKFNCNLVIIDFLIRHKQISKDHAYFQEIYDHLHQMNHDA